jgi:hypothetical protein
MRNHRLPIFAGIRLGISGFERPVRTRIGEAIVEHGGVWVPGVVCTPTANVTHLAWDGEKRTAKIQDAFAFNKVATPPTAPIDVVDQKWLWDSIQQQGDFGSTLIYSTGLNCLVQQGCQRKSTACLQSPEASIARLLDPPLLTMGVAPVVPNAPTKQKPVAQPDDKIIPPLPHANQDPWKEEMPPGHPRDNPIAPPPRSVSSSTPRNDGARNLGQVRLLSVF